MHRKYFRSLSRVNCVKTMAIPTLFPGLNTGDVEQEQEKLNKLK